MSKRRTVDPDSTASLASRRDGLVPMLAALDLERPFAWERGSPISGQQFLADAQACARQLPDGAMVNLCSDRYRFAVAFAAASIRGQPSLLPPDALPGTLARLHDSAPTSVYGSVDDDEAAETLRASGLPLRRVTVGHAPGGVGKAPLIPRRQRSAVLLTSGSTGAPTPHAKTFGTLVLNIDAAARRLAEYLELPLDQPKPVQGTRPSAKPSTMPSTMPSSETRPEPPLIGLNIVATVPPQHSYGFESTVLLAMLAGAAIDSGRPFYAADVAAALARLPRPRALVTTPFHLRAILDAGIDLPDVDLVLSATAPLSPRLAKQAEARFGGKLVEIYGCTEAGQVATRRPAVSNLWQTFDGLRVFEQTIERATQDGPRGATPSPSTSASTFMVEGGHVMEPTTLADILDLQDPSHFHLLGRANDLIHVAGRRSSLAHLDHHLNSIEGVVDGAFWLPPDVVDGVVRPVAFVVAPALAAGDVIQALRSRLEAVFVPRRIVHVHALPREATGKLTRRALGELAAAHGLSTAPGIS